MKAGSISAVTAIFFLMTACGGGGGGGSDAGTSSSSGFAFPVNPSKISGQPPTGVPSVFKSATNYGFAELSLDARSYTKSVSGFAADSIDISAFKSIPVRLFSASHLTDEVIEAWRQGWDGAGVTLSIIDDFTYSPSDPYPLTKSITANAELVATLGLRGGLTGLRKATYQLSYPLEYEFSHGSLVSDIAGGDYERLIEEVLPDPVRLFGTIFQYTPKVLSCDVVSEAPTSPRGYIFYTGNCLTLVEQFIFSDSRTSAYGGPIKDRLVGSDYDQIKINRRAVPGIAARANIVENHVALSAKNDPLQTVASIQGHLKNSSYTGVVNLSIGATIPTSGKTFQQVLNEVNKFPIDRVNAVIVVAAGNGGEACANTDLNGCNALAVAMAFQGSTAASTLVVGSLNGASPNRNIDITSTRAGILAQRFVLAPGDADAKVYSNKAFGTSFAAPRVAGIATILRQKYPSLSPQEIANIILLSADKDINGDGKDDFSGVSPIYGHGVASLSRALALLGTR